MKLSVFLDAECKSVAKHMNAPVNLRREANNPKEAHRWPGVRCAPLVVDQGQVYIHLEGPSDLGEVTAWGWSVKLDAQGYAESTSGRTMSSHEHDAQPVGGRQPSLGGRADKELLDALAIESGHRSAGEDDREEAVEHMKAPPPKQGTDIGSYFFRFVSQSTQLLRQAQKSGSLPFQRFSVQYKRPTHSKLQEFGWVELLSEFEEDDKFLSGR